MSAAQEEVLLEIAGQMDSSSSASVIIPHPAVETLID